MHGKVKILSRRVQRVLCINWFGMHSIDRLMDLSGHYGNQQDICNFSFPGQESPGIVRLC